MEAGPLRGTVYRLVGVVVEAGGGPRLSTAGLELFFTLSKGTLRHEDSGGDGLLVKDWERFFRGPSLKNSMTKVW